MAILPKTGKEMEIPRFGLLSLHKMCQEMKQVYSSCRHCWKIC
jgi:hypothetical protein